MSRKLQQGERRKGEEERKNARVPEVVRVERKVEHVDDPARLVDGDDRRGRSREASAVRLAVRGDNPRLLRHVRIRVVVVAREERARGVARDVRERNAWCGSGAVHQRVHVLDVCRDVGRPVVLRRRKVRVGRVREGVRRDRRRRRRLREHGREGERLGNEGEHEGCREGHRGFVPGYSR
jgi:hypothetical protein